MLAYCLNPKCKIVFEDRSVNIQGGPGSHLFMANNTVYCPKCGSKAKLIEGNFTFDKNGVMQFLSGPEITRDILNALKSLTEEARNKNYNATQFIEKAQSISPALLSLQQFLPQDNAEWRNIFYTLLIGLILLCMDKGFDYAMRQDSPQQPTIHNIKNVTYNINIKPYKPKVRKPINKKLRIIKK